MRSVMYFTIAVTLVFFAPRANATPETITYQGVLVDEGGRPLPDGLYDLTVRLGETANQPEEFVWEERFDGVPVNGGAFTVVLGEDPTNSLFANVVAAPFLFLELILHPADGSDDLVFSPRIPVTSVPYAIRAAWADTLEGQNVQDIVGTFAGTGLESTLSGGDNNDASGDFSTISGGELNVASGEHSTVSGGESNHATGENANVGGGGSNLASGFGGTVVGGSFNTASGITSIAGGASAVASGQQSVALGSVVTASGNFSIALGRLATATGDGAFCWADSTGEELVALQDQFRARASGGFFLATSADASTGVELLSGGGSWMNACDRNLKENLEQVDTADVLEKVAGIPISEWSYKAPKGVRHLGPTAQDFHAAFGLGTTDKGITTIDASGVALAAIQGLYAQNEELRERLEERESRLNALETEMAELRALVSTLTKSN